MFNINDHEAEILGIKVNDYDRTNASNLLLTIDLKHNNLLVHLKIHRDLTHFIIDLQQPRLRHNHEEFQIYTYESDEIWKNMSKTIRVSVNKPLQQVFNEIKRRFDWGKLAEYFEKLQEEHEEHEKCIKEHQEILEMITNQFKTKQLHIKKGDYRQDHTTISVLTPQQFWYSNENIVINRGGSVDISIKSIKNPIVFMKLVKVLADHAS